MEPVERRGRNARTLALVLAAAIFAALPLAAACGGGDKPLAASARATATADAQQPDESPGRTVAPPATATVAAPPAPRPANDVLPVDEPGVYLVGFDDFPPAMLERLAAYFREQHGVEVSVLAPVHLDQGAIHPERQQVIAERLLILLEQSRPNAPGAVVIGLTEYDMMIAGRPEWLYGFSLRADLRGVAVVSSIRMDPSAYGLRPDDDLLFDRLAKMAAKSVGLMHLGLPLSSDPRSLMYDNVLGPADLDRMEHSFAP